MFSESFSQLCSVDGSLLRPFEYQWFSGDFPFISMYCSCLPYLKDFKGMFLKQFARMCFPDVQWYKFYQTKVCHI